MKNEIQQALEWWNRENFKGSLYQKVLSLKYYPNGFDMDNEEQNIWEIWKKETQEFNQITPELSGLLIDFDKVETIEKAAKINAGFTIDKEIDSDERYYQSHKCEIYDASVKTAKSEASKNYWYQKFQEEQKSLKEQFEELSPEEKVKIIFGYCDECGTKQRCYCKRDD